MKNIVFIRRCAFLLAAIIIPTVFIVEKNQAAESQEKWLSLAEVKKKWDNIPLDKIKQAAETGDLTAQHYLGYSYATGERVSENGAESVAWYERALRGGYLPSASNLGLLYYKGQVVTQDFTKAIYYTRMAAEKGLAQAQCNLGHFYYDGIVVSRDYGESFKWFQRAAEQGHTGGMVGVGRAYRFGNGVKKNLDEAAKWFEKASQKNDSLGTLNLGLLYEEEDALSDEQKAIELYRQAAKQGSPEAMYKLYMVYRDGRGVSNNEEEAEQWLTKSAEAGYAWAQCELGYHFEYMDWGRYHETSHSNDMPVAIQWYRRSAEQNWPGGDYHLGLCYLEGKGVDKDEERGLNLIRKAAEQNHAYSLVKLAELYSRGIGEPRSEEDRPIHLLLRAAKLGLGKAYGELSGRYRDGLGTDRDLIKAAQWYCRAASADVPGYFLTEKMKKAEVVNPDDPFSVALAAYLKATKQNDSDAMTRIGDMYVVGRDVPQNPVEAWAWFKLAAESGNPAAQGRLTQVESKMTPSQIESAKQRASDLRQFSN